jgi:hypothetical protein
MDLGHNAGARVMCKLVLQACAPVPVQHCSAPLRPKWVAGTVVAAAPWAGWRTVRFDHGEVLNVIISEESRYVMWKDEVKRYGHANGLDERPAGGDEVQHVKEWLLEPLTPVSRPAPVRVAGRESNVLAKRRRGEPTKLKLAGASKPCLAGHVRRRCLSVRPKSQRSPGNIQAPLDSTCRRPCRRAVNTIHPGSRVQVKFTTGCHIGTVRHVISEGRLVVDFTRTKSPKPEQHTVDPLEHEVYPLHLRTGLSTGGAVQRKSRKCEVAHKLAAPLACACCLEPPTDPVETPCGHMFCRDCITQVSCSLPTIVNSVCSEWAVGLPVAADAWEWQKVSGLPGGLSENGAHFERRTFES